MLRSIGVVPKPLQKPHPPIFQPFASSEATSRWCAREGITAVIPAMHPENQRVLYEAYYDEAASAGRALELGEGLGALRDVIVADTDEEAMELWRRGPAFSHQMWFAPFNFGRGLIPPGGDKPMSPEEMMERGLLLVGSVDTVTRQIEQMKKVSPVRWIFAWTYNGLNPHDKILKSLELFKTKVLPRFDD